LIQVDRGEWHSPSVFHRSFYRALGGLDMKETPVS
jgi:hypothetical protein